MHPLLKEEKRVFLIFKKKNLQITTAATPNNLNSSSFPQKEQSELLIQFERLSEKALRKTVSSIKERKKILSSVIFFQMIQLFFGGRGGLCF